MGHFRTEPPEMAFTDLIVTCNLKSPVKHPTCLKNPGRPSCIDLILTNKRKSFQLSIVIETDISEFHKMVLTALKR